MTTPSRSAARRALAAAAAAASLSLTTAAHADGLVFRLPGLGATTYNFTNTTLLGYRTENFDLNRRDDNFLSVIERFDSQLTAAPWRLQVRVDGFWPFLHTPSVEACQPECYLRDDLRVERIALRYQRGPLTLEGGDVYTVLGRGVALSFRKVDPLGLDTTIRGGRAELDLGRFMVRGFGGAVNPQNLDSITLAVWGDTQTPGTFTERPGYDVLGGGELVGRVGPDEDLEVGVHALRVHFPGSLLRASDVDVLGWRMQAPSLLDGALAFHLEVNALRRTSTTYRPGVMPNEVGPVSRETERFGRGVFGSAQLTMGNWNALFEWKDYTNYVVSPDGSSNDLRRVYSSAPALEREDVQFRSNYNTRGGRIRVEHAFRPSPWSASITGVLSGFAEETDRDPWSDQSIGVAHGYVLVRRRGRTIRPATGAASADPNARAGAPGAGNTPGGGGDAAAGPVSSAASGIGGNAARVALGEWQLQVTAGYRHEWLFGPRGMGTFGRAGGAPDWLVWHGDVDVSFALTRDDSLEVRLDARLETRYDDNIGYYSYTRDGLTVTWSHSDWLQVSAVGRIDTLRQSQGRMDVPAFFPAVEARYRFLGGSSVRVFGGMTPGGRLCSGGVCRDVPPFQGALAELILRL